MCIFIYNKDTLNLGLEIAIFDQECEQGRFRGSTEGGRLQSRDITISAPIKKGLVGPSLGSSNLEALFANAV